MARGFTRPTCSVWFKLAGRASALPAPGPGRLQAAIDKALLIRLVSFAFDLLQLNGESTAQLPLLQRKERLQRLFMKEIGELRYSEHVVAFASTLASSGSRAPSQASRSTLRPGDRGIWVKSKCLNREEFVVVGWTGPEGSRSHIGALLLGYYTRMASSASRGVQAPGMTEKELKCPRQEQEGRASRGRLCDRTSSAGEGAEVIHQPATLMQESGR